MRAAHRACDKKHDSSMKEIGALITGAARGASSIESLKQKVSDIARNGCISDEELKALVVRNWDLAVQAVLDDNVLAREEEARLQDVQKVFGLTQHDLDQKGAFTKFVKGSVLRDVVCGTVPEKVNVRSGYLPFNFQKHEKLVWLFQGVKYYEQKTCRHHVRRLEGSSIRVAKGVYFRMGGFKARPIVTAETLHVDTGLLAITSEHVYFTGAYKSFRIAFPKIVAFEPYKDGIGIQRDAASANPQRFLTGDGWFTYNLVMNLGHRLAAATSPMAL